MNPDDLWAFLPWGYVTTVLIEGPILFVGLSPRHSWTTRLIAAFWLTGCTYPIVVLVLPSMFGERMHELYWLYLLIAETFAPAAECLLFWAAFLRPVAASENAEMPQKADEDEPTGGEIARDMATIVVANLASFGLGMLLR